ncbi:MAG: response regulator [bacterium]|nr:response regulator [bacterium]
MTILCVDDDRTTLKLISKSLEKAYPNEKILEAQSGEEAIEVLKSNPADILITDLIMPGMSGIDVLERVKRDRPQTEVIMMTAYTSVESAIESMQKGARDYLAKPISIELLTEKVENLRTLIQSQREVEDYRYAMDTISEDVSRSAQKTEEKLSRSGDALLQILEILDSPVEPNVKLKLIREAIGCLEMSHT